MERTRVGAFSVLLILASCMAPQPSSGSATNPPAPWASSTTALDRSAQGPSLVRAGKSEILGTIHGRPFAVKSAIYMWREKANDMQIVLADVDHLCASLQAGGWPKEATVLTMTLKHNTAESRDVPFSAGDYSLRTGDERAAQDVKSATYMQLDAQCTPTIRAVAARGSVHVSTSVVKIDGTVEGEVDLGMGRDNEPLTGKFVASFCKPPENEPQGCK